MGLKWPKLQVPDMGLLKHGILPRMALTPQILTQRHFQKTFIGIFNPKYYQSLAIF
jgi:hypothetical protein